MVSRMHVNKMIMIFESRLVLFFKPEVSFQRGPTIHILSWVLEGKRHDVCSEKCWHLVQKLDRKRGLKGIKQ